MRTGKFCVDQVVYVDVIDGDPLQSEYTRVKIDEGEYGVVQKVKDCPSLDCGRFHRHECNCQLVSIFGVDRSVDDPHWCGWALLPVDIIDPDKFPK